MKMAFARKLIALVAVGTLLALNQPASANITLNWAAGTDNGFGLEDGTDLAQGSLIRLGTFTNLTFTQISTYSPTMLEPYFVELGNSTIGTGFPVDAHFQAQSILVNPSAAIQALAGSYLYMYASNLSNGIPYSGILQYAILTMTNDSNWLLPPDSPVANTTIDISDLTDGPGTSLLSGALILAGGFGVGTSDATEVPLFNLRTIPEPSAYGIIAAGLAVVAGLRFRRRK